ncbi:hypothetical protein I598_1909 [Isoptericola dokdonensis DS-3]|uniref:Uncharacterized protein n=1 Tax=Isoptericola dokdonensis DS-3 TaxID=1300344 RepID=A0A161IDW7_9MICO|nr:hypothetical protein I598_1909 [Isoptericola dokdonensis DS-3]
MPRTPVPTFEALTERAQRVRDGVTVRPEPVRPTGHPPAAQRPTRAEMAGWAVCGGDPDAERLDGVCWHRGWWHPLPRTGFRAKAERA